MFPTRPSTAASRSSSPVRHILLSIALLAGMAGMTGIEPVVRAQPAGDFSLEAVRGYPFPQSLTAAGSGSRIAWTIQDQGRRNVWVAEGPDFAARQLTQYDADDGQELTSLHLSHDGKYVVYVRGGEHGSNWDGSLSVNALSSPIPTPIQLWAAPFDGGKPVLLADQGDAPAISPRGDVVAFVKEGNIWIAPLDGSKPAEVAVAVRGTSGSLAWSPDGSKLAFLSSRGDHAFIGLYTDAATPIRWVAPSTARDATPRWSPDGKQLAFVRRPGTAGAPTPTGPNRAPAWRIMVADVDADGAEPREVWRSPRTRGGVPSTHGGTNLQWAAHDRIVFLSYTDGWPHLYSVDAVKGGQALKLTSGNYMVEHVRLSPDRRYLVASANTGPDKDDLNRRHVLKIPVDRAAAEVLTPGTDLEWTPVVTGDGERIVYLSATPQRPPLPAVMPATGGKGRLLAKSTLPADFPKALVTPKPVVFKSPDGVEVHNQLFESEGGPAKKPAIVYIHGGPARQMLLGWHYSDYYSNAYALNQYLASRGFVVLSVNYRRGIGYGYAFHNPANAGASGASEYQDIKAASEYLRSLPQVDGSRIGLYGGSYGGFLTALGLGRDSDLFAAGVDIHGVHRRTPGLPGADGEDSTAAVDTNSTAWKSSPIAYIDTWKSPVLLIHGDDDRNVSFSHTVDLARRLETAGIAFEQIVMPDETHHMMLYRNQLRANEATAEFLERKLAAPAGR